MRQIRSEDVKVGDALKMTSLTTWVVTAIEPYNGTMPEMVGARIAVTDRGRITLEPGGTWEVRS